MRVVLLLLCAMPLFGATLRVHVNVALCDNASQGIVPVPAAIGDGNDPRTNLYWGAAYGLKTWLKKDGWSVQKAKITNPAVLERIVAKKKIGGRDVEIVADAWRGNRIRDAITAFLEEASYGGSDIIAYIGHDGLMEFEVSPRVGNARSKPRSIVLACASLQYFGRHLQRAGSRPLLLTTGLMAPEAYTLTAAIEAHVRGGDVREAAARAYDRYQKCGMKAARRLFR
ncbi:MAG TPA: hypothetical protein VHW00_16650 [Thermoanaerobaculia bacterium]|nr:hypothetical protein [Thermoanaerobaculia bacterium]